MKKKYIKSHKKQNKTITDQNISLNATADESSIQCCQSGCEDCPFDFKKLKIDPNIPRELQLDQSDENEYID